ncbi:MAG: IS630 transposase-related protein [Deinococcaceae bacterium]
MPVTYSLDLRKRIVEKYYEGYTIKEVAEIYNVSSSAVGRYLQLDDNNVLEPKKRGTKKPPRIDIADFENLRAMVQSMPDITLEKACQEWEKMYGVTVKKATMYRAFQRAGIKYKKNLYRT